MMRLLCLFRYLVKTGFTTSITCFQLLYDYYI
jgi:hypothetical protein